MIAIQCTAISGICQDCSANKALFIMADTLAIYKKHVGYSLQVPGRAVGCSDGSHSECHIGYCHISLHVGTNVIHCSVCRETSVAS